MNRVKKVAKMNQKPKPICAECGKPIDGEVMEGMRAGKPITGHPACAFRKIAEEQGKMAATLAAILGGVVKKLGGSARIHQLDIAAAQQAGGVASKDEEGGFIHIWLGKEEPRIILAGAMPAGPMLVK
jgi:hypothetical protein